jgi:LuxR family maltose regulon positive regulatory protein
MATKSRGDERTETTASIPTSPPYFVDRRRIDHLYQLADGRLLRVLAPSGYGKTSLVARWVAAETRPVCWIDLGRADDDPVTLFHTLQNALAGIITIPPPSVDLAITDPYVGAIEIGLSERQGPFVLVLDDAHRIRSANSQRLIRTVVEHLRDDSTVVLVGHGHHDHGTIGRMRLVPGVVDVSVDELAFDTSEAQALLARMDVDVEEPGVTELLTQLEGWPAGIRLVAEAVRAGAAPPQLAKGAELVGSLDSKWLGELDAEDRMFLREAACLQRFTAEQCDQVLGRHGSREIIQRLHRDRLVVFPLDKRNEYYRLHGLLSRWLSADLQRSDPRRWTEIHVDAARYFEQHDDIDLAVQHAISAADDGLLEALMIDHGARFFPMGRRVTVTKWLDASPPDFVHASPGPIGLRCLEALQSGDDLGAVDWLRRLDHAIALHNRPADDPTRRWASVLHATLDERPADELIPIIAAVRRELTAGPWGAFASWVHGALAFMVGDITTARDALRAGEFEASLARAPLLVGHCAATSSIIDACEGDEAAAAASARRAHDAVTTYGGELVPPSAAAVAAVALQHARLGDRDAAANNLDVARRALDGYRSIAPWFNVIVRLPLVRAATLIDDRPTALALIQELEHHARHEPWGSEPPAHSAPACAQLLRSHTDAMHVPTIGSSALTDAELRVLHLLPTNLGLAEIATQLFVSRNTVKSHVASIYRKLDATRRAEAVEQAKQAGLLPTTSTL